jgi:hypothetical protein
MPIVDSVQRDGWRSASGEVLVDAANERPGRRRLDLA